MSQQKDSARKENAIRSFARLPRATAMRLSWYLRYLRGLNHSQTERVSSQELANALGVSAAQVRKDLAAIGSLGQPGIGYPPDDLTKVIRNVLGLDRTWPVVLVGVGNLGRALLRYAGFRQQGFHFVAIFDNDPSKVGQTIENLRVLPMKQLAEIVQKTNAQLAIISVPADAAQQVADQLVAVGICGILNFAPTVLHVPHHVSVVSVDLTVQLEQLTYLVLHKNQAPSRKPHRYDASVETRENNRPESQ